MTKLQIPVARRLYLIRDVNRTFLSLWFHVTNASTIFLTLENFLAVSASWQTHFSPRVPVTCLHTSAKNMIFGEKAACVIESAVICVLKSQQRLGCKWLLSIKRLQSHDDVRMSVTWRKVHAIQALWDPLFPKQKVVEEEKNTDADQWSAVASYWWPHTLHICQ